MKANSKIKNTLLSILVWLGYVGTLLSWCWLIICYSKDFMTSELVNWLIYQSPREQPTDLFELPSITLPPQLLAAIAAVLAIGVVVFVVTMIFRTPGGVQKISDKAAHSSADLIVPKIAKYRTLNKREKFTLHTSIVYGLRLLISWLPLAVTTVIGQQSSFVPFSYMLLGTLLPAIWATLFFSLSLTITILTKKSVQSSAET